MLELELQSKHITCNPLRTWRIEQLQRLRFHICFERNNFRQLVHYPTAKCCWNNELQAKNRAASFWQPWISSEIFTFHLLHPTKQYLRIFLNYSIFKTALRPRILLHLLNYSNNRVRQLHCAKQKSNSNRLNSSWEHFHSIEIWKLLIYLEELLRHQTIFFALFSRPKRIITEKVDHSVGRMKQPKQTLWTVWRA